jgi:amino acid transporter
MGVLPGGLGVLFTVYTLAHFAGQFPGVGSFVTYISKGLGGRASVTFGVVIEVGYLLLQSSTVIALGLWTQDLLQTWFHVSVPWQVIAIIGGAILYALMIRGIRVTARGALILFVSEVVILLLLAIFVLAKGGANGISLSPFTFEHANGARGLGLAFVVALYMFVAWEEWLTTLQVSQGIVLRSIPLPRGSARTGCGSSLTSPALPASLDLSSAAWHRNRAFSSRWAESA